MWLFFIRSGKQASIEIHNYTIINKYHDLFNIQSNPNGLESSPARPAYITLLLQYSVSHTRHTHTLQMQMHDAMTCQWDRDPVLCQPRNVTSHRKHTTLIPVKCQLLSVCGHAHADTWPRPFAYDLLTKHTEKLQKQRKGERERERTLAKGSLLFYWLHVQARLTAACIFKKSRLSAGTPGPPSQRRIEWLFLYSLMLMHLAGEGRGLCTHLHSITQSL